MLLHLMWPRSQNRRFFLDEAAVVQMAGPAEALEEFEMDDAPEDPLVPIPTHAPRRAPLPTPPHLTLAASAKRPAR